MAWPRKARAARTLPPDGYWRGPIWAPSTLLIVEGLAAIRATLSWPKTWRAGSATMAAKSGFAENFDALTGAGLRDRAYTWTRPAFPDFGA